MQHLVLVIPVALLAACAQKTSFRNAQPGLAVSLFFGGPQPEPRNRVALQNLTIAYDLQGNRTQAAEANLALSMALSARASAAYAALG